jgi:hypothetical protein
VRVERGLETEIVTPPKSCRCDIVGGIDNLRSPDSAERTSAVKFETNAIAGFVPSSIYSRKKQMLVFKGQLFISI